MKRESLLILSNFSFVAGIVLVLGALICWTRSYSEVLLIRQGVWQSYAIGLGILGFILLGLGWAIRSVREVK